MIKYKKLSEEKLEELFQSNDFYDRIIAVKNHYKINELIKDKNWIVRREVARHGFSLDVLITDEDPAFVLKLLNMDLVLMF